MFIFIILSLIPISYANIYVHYLDNKRYFIILFFPKSSFLFKYLYKKYLFSIMVSNKCCVNGCHESSKTKFGVPIKDIDVWEKSLSTQLTSVSRVCAKHFNNKMNPIISIYAKEY